jgi:tripartite-type tricarboxylate transporter receptor subunit TctC
MNVKHLFAGIAAACMLIGNCLAAGYPDKVVKIIVPWPPGGLVDMPARLIAARLSKKYGQSFIVENKPGAGGIIGAQEVARSEPDGYTLMVTTSALNMNAAIRKDMPFDVHKAFDPVAVFAYAPSILVVNPAKGPKSVSDLIALAKSKPGKLTYASAGIGTPAQFAAELFKTMEGLDIIHVPYKGAPPAMMDQIAGLIDFHFANAAVALPQIQAGKVIGLAVTSPKRFPPLPNIPTMAEAGVPNFDADQWVGVLAPHGTPKTIINDLNAEINKMLTDDEIRAKLTNSGMVAATAGSPGEFAQYLKKDLARWTDVARVAHIQAQ